MIPFARTIRTLTLTGLLLLMLLPITAALAAVVPVSDSFTLDLSTATEVLEDPGHRLDVDAVRRSDRWQRNHESDINYGIRPDSTWWFRFSLTNPHSDDRQTLLDIDSIHLDDLIVTVFDDGGNRLARFITGDHQPFDSRPLSTRSFVFPLHLAANTEYTVIIESRSSGAMSMPLMLYGQRSFWLHERLISRIDGAVFGVILVMLFYNLVLLGLTRQRGYLFYVLNIAALGFNIALHNGYGLQYLWPDNPLLNEQILRLMTGLMIITGQLFAIEILSLRQQARRLWQVSLAIIVIMLPVTVWGTFIGAYPLVVKYYVVMVLTSSLFIIGSGSYVALQGDRIARYYILAWTPLLMSFVYYALNRIGITPLALDPVLFIKLCTTLEAVLFSLVLAARIQEEREARLQAQHQLFEWQKNSTRDLQQKVRQRTEELERALRKLETLSTTDQLTGLWNRRYFDRQFNADWQRCQRESQPLAIIVLDIDFFKKINDNYGHQTGDQVLRQFAETIQKVIHRSTDYACRYGGEEFVVVLPNTPLPGAVEVAEAIRSTVAARPFEIGNQRLPVTVSAGLAVAVPTSVEQPARLIEQADQVLYRAKKNGRNRIEYAGQAELP